MNFELIDSVSFLLFTCILYFLSVFSKRFGDVMGMKKYYYLYYAGMLFTFSGSVMMSLSVPLLEPQELFGYVFFSIGLTLGLIASTKYWGWLIKEIIKG
jgi:hypothetical protein